MVGTRINVNQGIALADELPLFVVHIGDDAIHLAGDRSGVNGRDGADGIEVDADVALPCGCGDESDGAASTSWGFCGCRGCVALAHDEVKSAREDQEENNPDEGTDTFVPGRNSREMFRACGCANILISRQVGGPLSSLCSELSHKVSTVFTRFAGFWLQPIQGIQ